MIVRVVLSVDLDQAEWFESYGLSRDPSVIRGEVREYVAASVAELHRLVQADAYVELRDR